MQQASRVRSVTSWRLVGAVMLGCAVTAVHAAAPDADADGVPDYIDANPADAGVAQESILSRDGNYVGQRLSDRSVVGDVCDTGAGLTPASATVASAGATGNAVTIAAPTSCGWTAVSQVPWLTLVSGLTGSGSGSVVYDVAANPSSLARNGSLLIGGTTFPVQQAGVPCQLVATPIDGGAYMTVTGTSVTIVVIGGTFVINLAATPADCVWSAGTNVTWLTVTAGNGMQTGSGSVEITVAPNTSHVSRAGRVTFTAGSQSKSVTVTQGY